MSTTAAVPGGVLLDPASLLQAVVMSTGNSLDFTASDLKVMLAHHAALKDMEVCQQVLLRWPVSTVQACCAQVNAIAWVAAMFGTPLLAVKVCTK